MSLLWLLCLSILLPSGILYEFRPFTFTPYSSKKYQKQKTYKDRELALTVHDVIPDVIECTPQFQLEVTYLEEFKVDHGNILEINNVAFAPLKVEWPAEKNESYVLSMTGPDYPSRENRSEYEEWNHWLVVNIEGDKWLNGDVIAPYIPPYCRKGLGFHRYVFVIYKQPRKHIQFNETRLDASIDDRVRANFSLRAFAVKYQLQSPLAGNFFFTP